MMLVAYHAVGANQQSGLELSYPHPLRFFADFFVDMRMPLFAFIAGWVYALRPARRGSILGFLGGKFRRLVVPGLCASVISWVVMKDVVHSLSSGDVLADVLALTFIHFWFLQAILVIFLTCCVVEVFFGPRLMIPVLALVSITAFLCDLPTVGPIRLGGASYLGVYFCMGLFCHRYQAIIRANVDHLIWPLIGLLLLGCILDLYHFANSGSSSVDRRDFQSRGVVDWCGAPALALPSQFLPSAAVWRGQLHDIPVPCLRDLGHATDPGSCRRGKCVDSGRVGYRSRPCSAGSFPPDCGEVRCCTGRFSGPSSIVCPKRKGGRQVFGSEFDHWRRAEAQLCHPHLIIGR